MAQTQTQVKDTHITEIITLHQTMTQTETQGTDTLRDSHHFAPNHDSNSN